MPDDKNIADLLTPEAQAAAKGESVSGNVVIRPKAEQKDVLDAKPEAQKMDGFDKEEWKKMSVWQRLKWGLFYKKSPAKKQEKKEEKKEAPSATPPVAKAELKPDMSKQEKSDELKNLKAVEKVYYEGMATLRDMIAPASMEVQSNHFKIGDTYTRSFFVYAYPRFIEANWLAPLINLDATIDISMFVLPQRSDHMLKVLRNKVAQMHSSMRINAEKGKVRDPALETALQDAEELRDQLQRGEEKFFHLGLYLTLSTKTLEQLDKMTTEIETILGGKLVLTKRANLQQEHGFTSTLPLALDEIQITRNMNTSPLSTTFPFSSSELTSDKGILYGLNRHNDSLIIFDRFSLENANSVVFAKSGAGKSYAVKLEILRLMMMGVDVLVIDPEKEYKDLCETVGGSFVNISLNSMERINPFDLPMGVKDDDTRPGDLLRSAIINLHGLFSLMMGRMSPEEEAIMDKALLDCYALKGITMDTENPGEFDVPTMQDLYDVLSTVQGAQSLATRLQKFTTGTYAGIFNQPTNVDLQSGMVVFNIRDLEDELRPIATYIVLNYIWNKVRSSLKKRILVVDEAWVMMQHEDSAKFLYGLVKRARKYWLGVTTITQDVDDFIGSKYGKPIITNSSMQLLLKQAPSAVEGLGDIFNLTEGEKYMLLNSAVGQGLFFAGNKHVACQIIASYSEDQVITTDPEEILKREDNVTYDEE